MAISPQVSRGILIMEVRPKNLGTLPEVLQTLFKSDSIPDFNPALVML